MFMPTDEDKANRELECVNYCYKNAIEKLAQGKFEESAVYHENVARSLRELQKLRNTKIAWDKLPEPLKRLSAQGSMIQTARMMLHER